MKYEITVHGTMRLVDIETPRPGIYRLRWQEGDALQEHTVDVYRPSPEALQLLIDGESWEAGCVATERGYLVDVVGVCTDVEVVDPRRKALRLAGASASGMVATSMPGRIVRLMVAVGDRVTKGQPVIVVEAMKMENELRAPKAGKVAKLQAVIGAAVEGGATLCVVE